MSQDGGSRGCGAGVAGPSERAVEAAARLLDAGGVTHPSIGPPAEAVARDLLAAAFPVIVAEVVEKLRAQFGDEQPFGDYADFIEREFG